MCKIGEIKCIVVGERSRVKRLGCMVAYGILKKKDHWEWRGKSEFSGARGWDYEVSA